MKFSTILVLFGFAAFAIAADSTTETGTSAAPTASLTPLQQCLKTCKDGDVNCQAACVGVPSPDTAAVNATTKCVADCTQGSGSVADNQKYSDCVKACITSNFITTTQTGAPQSTVSGSTETGSAASASGTNTGNSRSTGTGSSASATRSGTSATASSTAGSAPALVASGSFLGLFAIVAGIVLL
jgi:hypothetical protein